MAGLLAGLGCGEATPSPEPPDRTVGVVVRDDEFFPAEVTVSPGETVTWVWEGQSQHSLRFFGSPALAAPAQVDGLYARSFETPGTYDYYCTIHGGESGLSVTGMSGRVVVPP